MTRVEDVPGNCASLSQLLPAEWPVSSAAALGMSWKQARAKAEGPQSNSVAGLSLSACSQPLPSRPVHTLCAEQARSIPRLCLSSQTAQAITLHAVWSSALFL